MTPQNTNKLFLAGLMGSGTTVTLNVLLALDFGSGIQPYIESWQDPKCPRKWKGRFCSCFPDGTRGKIQDWIYSYCKKDWFIEKTPTRFTHFLALQELFGDRSHFVVVQRHPVQILASRARTRAARAKLSEEPRKNHKKNTLRRDDEFAAMWGVKFANMIKFHRKYRPQLRRFMYVRYESLCADPVRVISNLLSFLQVEVSSITIERVCKPVELKHKYNVSNLHPLMLSGVRKLARLWEYPLDTLL